mgnify:CR=1 FL=1
MPHYLHKPVQFIWQLLRSFAYCIDYLHPSIVHIATFKLAWPVITPSNFKFLAQVQGNSSFTQICQPKKNYFLSFTKYAAIKCVRSFQNIYSKINCKQFHEGHLFFCIKKMENVLSILYRFTVHISTVIELSVPEWLYLQASTMSI